MFKKGVIMDIESLKESLKPWMCNETWTTSHPSDQKRFNKALNNAISKFGTDIHSSDLEQAISSLAEAEYPAMDKNYRYKLVVKFVIQAENVLTYLSDTKWGLPLIEWVG
jgi:hypothetical protein